MTDDPAGASPGGRRRPPRRRPEAATVLLVGLGAAALLLGTLALRDLRAGDRFDLVRWERTTLAGQWTARLGVPLRGGTPPDEALRRFFAAPSGSDERARLENDVEAAIRGRVDAVLREHGLRGRLPLPGTVFPPVAFELAASPRVLVQSPRAVIERRSTELLRPDLPDADAVALEQSVEARDRTVSALVVSSGGVAAYPAVVFDRGSYAETVSGVAHEWTHHYLAFYRLGVGYFESADTTAINETVADLVGDEVAAAVITRWGDPTRPDAAAASPAGASRPTDLDATLRDLRLEVDALLAAGRIEEAEARMEAVRVALDARGAHIRRLNQAYFAWYGTYAARPDAVDPLGGQLREIRQRTGSLAAFVARVREVASRADVERLLADVRAAG